MIPHVKELIKILGHLSSALEKNLDPHIYGPPYAAIEGPEIDGVQVYLPDAPGQYLPVNEGDQAPGILTWEMPNALEFAVKNHENFAYEAAGLSRMLFDPEGSNVGGLSGQALRRLLIPFYSRVLHLSEVCRVALAESFQMIFSNSQLLGQEIPDVALSEIEIHWGYSDFFQDLEDDEEEENNS